jgi:hypothetical protein
VTPRRPVRRPIRSAWRLSIASVFAAFGIVLVMVVDPYSGSYADAATAPNHWIVINGQSYVAQGTYSLGVSHGKYGVIAPAPHKAALSTAAFAGAPAAGTPDPGSAKAIAQQILASRGMGNDQYSCLVSLWDRESHWNVYAANPSGAYGIPQALPGSKMASVGADWRTNPKTQIIWGLQYITGRYGTPCGAWSHSQSSGWY